jgi:hypothetical protein
MTAPATRTPLTAAERLLLRVLTAITGFGLLLVSFALTAPWLDADMQMVWLLVWLLFTCATSQFMTGRRT